MSDDDPTRPRVAPGRRLRRLATVVVGVLALVLPVAVAQQAQAAPEPPTVTQVFDPWVTSSERVSVRGSMGVGVDRIEVEVSSDGGASYSLYCGVDTSADVDATVWSCDVGSGSVELGTPLRAGENLLRATAVDAETGDRSAPGAPITITRAAPPVIVDPVDGRHTNEARPTVSGTAPETAEAVTVYRELAAGGVQPVCTTEDLAGGRWSCAAESVLPDGAHTIFAYTSPGGLIGDGQELVVDTTAPAAPQVLEPGGPLDGGLPHAEATDAWPLIVGHGEPGSTVTVTFDGSPVGCAEPAVVDDAEAWQCAPDVPVAAGTHLVGAWQTDLAGNASGGGQPVDALWLTMTVTPPPAQPPVPAPSAPSPSPEGPATSDDAAPPLQARTPVVVGADPPVAMPEPGAGVPETSEDPSPRPTAAPSLAAPETEPAAAGPAEVDRDDPGAPGSLASGLTTVQALLAAPEVLGVSLLTGLLVLLLIIFPARLLNTAAFFTYDRIFGSLVGAGPRWWQAVQAWFAAHTVVGGLLLSALAAFAFGLADPDFGLDAVSLRQVAASAVWILVGVAGIDSAARRIASGTWRVEATLVLRPLALVLSVAGVGLSRLLDVTPGFLIGLLVGLVFAGTATPRQRMRTVLLRTGMLLGLTAAGWIGFSLLRHEDLGQESFALALLQDVCAVSASAGVASLLFALLPLRGLDGFAIFSVSRRLWALEYLPIATLFAVLVLPDSTLWERGDAWLWSQVALLVVFALMAIAAYVLALRAASTDMERQPAGHGGR